MDIQGIPASICLERLRSMTLVTRNPVTLVCASGLLWLTDTAAPSDLFLRAGERMEIASGKRYLITAVENATVTVIERLPASARPRVWLRPRSVAGRLTVMMPPAIAPSI